MKLLDDALTQLERWHALDAVAEPVRAVTRAAVKPRLVRDLLSGTGLGHPLHPVLTDLPIGAWSMAAVLDLMGEPTERGADVLVAAGLVAAVPTAAAGFNDWTETNEAESRVGIVHAALNVTALGLYGASLAARKAGARTAGRGLAFAGLGILLTSGYLGGHLAFSKGVRVSRAAWHEGPVTWQDVGAADDVAEGTPTLVEAGGVPLLLVHDDGRLVALDNVCTHAGGPLNEGTVSGGCVTCPLHGSTFRLADGSVVHGPASVPQPSYEVRVRDGRVLVRARRRKAPII
ncbi:Rieske 2Fe-2S domain-containing protein [Sinomonas mesophila]|uniref:Rieske 2Fe-2S domain-containing protein n=1 Tax=Sinomonas mesophila TaxID=1531955 RepID=UPI000984B905|nr:Rieske 2Fe-2S domain-containing protein [Sinomonas mesophila]